MGNTRLFMRPEEEPLGGTRGEQLGRLIEEAGEGRTVWASFDWVRPIDMETALEQQRRLSELVDASKLVVKTAAVEEAIDDWPASQLRRVQSVHSAIILASEEELSLSRATPMPLTLPTQPSCANWPAPRPRPSAGSTCGSTTPARACWAPSKISHSN